jgi:hypothetical protein
VKPHDKSKYFPCLCEFFRVTELKRLRGVASMEETKFREEDISWIATARKPENELRQSVVGRSCLSVSVFCVFKSSNRF